MPAYIDTGLNVVHVRDVALGHLLACETGRPGERYILGSTNLTLGQILQELARLTGRKAPTIELPYFVALRTAGMVTTAWANITGVAPRVCARSGAHGKEEDVGSQHEKAARELGYSPCPATSALADAVVWFGKRGGLPHD